MRKLIGTNHSWNDIRRASVNTMIEIGLSIVNDLHDIDVMLLPELMEELNDDLLNTWIALKKIHGLKTRKFVAEVEKSTETPKEVKYESKRKGFIRFLSNCIRGKRINDGNQS